MESAVNTKSGKGVSHGVISELATYWEVIPGHEDEARAATLRFADKLRATPPEVNARTGLRDSRHVIFDNGRRLMWATTFETPWDPYVDDFILIGVHYFVDWMQHTTQAAHVLAWLEEAGGAEKFSEEAGRQVLEGNTEVEANLKRSTPGLKAIIQSVQSPATGYFNAVSELTLPQIDRAQRLQEAFQQVLDDPAAPEALQHPALKPLLELAAD